MSLKEFQITYRKHSSWLTLIALDPEAIKDRLQTNIEEVKCRWKSFWKNWFITWKLDIYRRVRFTNHLDYFLETINGTEANGRKLGFITKKWVVNNYGL
jgi:hypothetical protein